MLGAIFLMAAEVAVADPAPLLPAACPAIDSIKSATEQFTASKRQDASQGKYDVTQTSQYGTQQTWVLIIPGIDYMYTYAIKTENDAVEFAKKAIKNIATLPTSAYVPEWINNHWVCRLTFQYLPQQANLVLSNNV